MATFGKGLQQSAAAAPASSRAGFLNAWRPKAADANDTPLMKERSQAEAPPDRPASGAAAHKATAAAPDNDSPSTSERDRLYEAYNELHALAQSFSRPFDAPAILVVGHQTDGKSGTPRAAYPCAVGSTLLVSDG
jgi:hypothetical protein